MAEWFGDVAPRVLTESKRLRREREMTKPEEIPQDVWDTAFNAMPPVNREAYETSPFALVLHLGFARAIMAEREACAVLADDFRHDNPFPTIMGAVASAIRNRGAT